MLAFIRAAVNGTSDETSEDPGEGPSTRDSVSARR